MYIHMTVLTGNLIGNATGVDEMASAANYRDLLQQALLECWPQAVIEIKVEHAEGMAAPTQVYVGEEEDPDLEEEADTIAAHVWAAGDWLIRKEEST